jgi:outer membrane lipoprotein carrier protein
MFHFFKRIIILATFAALGAPAPVLAASAKSKPKAKASAAIKAPELREIEKKYSQTSALSARVQKSLKLKMMDQEKKYEGLLEIKKPGMFRLEFEKPEKSLAITDGKMIWVATYPTDPDIDNTIRVIRSTNPERIQSQALIGVLLGRGSLLNEFNITSVKKEKENTTYILEPKTKTDDVKKLQLNVNSKKKEINEIKYWDNLDNETVLTLDNTKFDQDIKPDRFQYTIPKGAEVQDL